MKILAPISLGELYDKISILEIKSGKVTDPEKLGNVRKELNILLEISSKKPINKLAFSELKVINKILWDIEDNIRVCEKRKDFGEKFIRLARNVYICNDKRFAIKNEINIENGSEIVEEKEYVDN